MKPLLVDATTLIALGHVGELELLLRFDGQPVVPDEVRAEVTTEPARANLEQFRSRPPVTDMPERSTHGEHDPLDRYVEDAQSLLEEEETNGDVRIISYVLAITDGNPETSEVGVISDDARVRTVAEGLGGTVTGTVGVVVRAVQEGMSPEEAKELLRRVDDHGLHMTAELRETAYRLVDDAAAARNDDG